MKAKWAALSLACATTLSGWTQAAEQPAAKPALKPVPVSTAPKPTYVGNNPKTMPATAGTADNTPPAGFTALFNGKDLTNWKGLLDPKKKLDNPMIRAKLSPEEQKAAQAEADENMKTHWSVKDGELLFDPGAAKSGRSLATAKDYGNFEMWTTWKIPPMGDSGIYVRGCPQIQIWDIANARVHAEVGSGGLYNNQKVPASPLLVADNPIGEWNTFFIRMVGDKVTVYLNGKLVTDEVPLENYWSRKDPIPTKEQIELQNHGDHLWFKNVYIKELPDTAK